MSSRRRSKKLKTSAIRTTDDLLHEKGIGKWLSLDAEDLTHDGDVRYSRKASSGRTRLVDGRHELPFVDIERDEQVDYQRQFDMFNSMLDHDTRVGQTRRQHQYYIHSGVSEDSDYTSDVNYPIGGGQQPQRPNSSASYHHYGSSTSATHHRSPRHHQHHQQHHQLATPQRSLNSSRENSYEKDDDYRHNGQSSSYYPATSTSSTSQQQQQQRRHRQLPQTHGLSSNHSSSSQTQQQQQQYLTAQSQSRQFSHRSRTSTSSSQQEQTQEYWDDPRDYETDPLYYNSRPQSFKPYSAYRRHDSWDDGYNSYRKEDSYSRQYTDDYEDAQDDYCQPSHNYSKRLKNNRRGTHSLERQDTLYHDDIPGDYHLDVHDSNSRLYDNDRYSSTSSSHNQHHRQHSLQKDSGYDQYSLDYGDYGEDTSFYGNDDSTIPQASASSTIDQYDQYEEDNRYSYDSQDWGTEADSRDHYSTTSSTKPPKRLPQIPTTQKQHSLRTDSYSEDAYHDTPYDDYGMASTADDTYYSNKDYNDDEDDTYDDDARTIVPEPIPPTTVTAAVAVPTSSTQQLPYNKQQQYHTQQYQNQTQADEQLTQTQRQQQQTTTTTTQKHVKNTQQSYPAQETHQHQNQQQHQELQPENLQEQHHHDQSQEYYDTSVPYENQTWYDESWGYNGYYDEAGNFISYDSTSYYDESGNLVTTADQDQYGGYYGDDTTGSAATAVAVDQTYPQIVPTSTSQPQQQPQPQQQQSRADQQYNHHAGNTAEAESLSTTTQQEESLDQYDNTDYYYSGGDQDYNYEDYYGYGDGKDYSSYDAGDYVDESEEYHEDHGIPSGSDTATTADQYNNKPSQYQSSSSKKSQLHSLQSQSSVEYNYAYQSAENLSSSLPYEDALSQAAKTSITTTTTVIATSVTTGSTAIASSSLLERANSSTRRASFRRQVTRDYGLDGGPDSRSQSFDAPTHPLDVPPTHATNANEKSETFRNGIRVTVQDTIDLGLGYSMSIEDDNYNPADPQWQEGYDYGNEDWKSSEDWNKSEEDRRTYEDQKSHESQEQGYETQDTSRDNGPVHMDSLESTTSDQAARDPDANDKFEAQYWQKQQERIAKQATLTAQDSFGYDYDIGKGAGAAFFEPVVDMNDPISSSVIDQVDHAVLSRMNSEEEWTGRGSKKNSLDIEQEEWLSGLDRKGSQRSMRGSHTNLISRQESITLDTHPEEDDEYLIGGPPGTEDRVGRKVSVDSIGLANTAAKLAMLNEIEDDTMISIREEPGERKSSLEVTPGLEKAIKSVSFEEDPPKMIAPERQTKGMTPREKWLWSMNRICSQLAVS